MIVNNLYPACNLFFRAGYNYSHANLKLLIIRAHGSIIANIMMAIDLKSACSLLRKSAAFVALHVIVVVGAKKLTPN